MDAPRESKPERGADLAAAPTSENMQEPTGREDAEVTTMVCVTCGAERFFTDDVPEALTCEKCGASVFRAFTTPVATDEVAAAAAEEQARSTAYGDASPQTSPDEVRDLGR